MVEKQKYKAYVAASQTVAPVRQIVLLYEGIIRLVQQAKDAIGERRIEDRYNLLVRASELIGGLQNCLDFENGGKIAPILYSYYSSIDAKLFTIHRTNSVEDCDTIIGDLKQMRDAWIEVDSGEATKVQQDTNVAGFSTVSDIEIPIPPLASEGGMSLSA